MAKKGAKWSVLRSVAVISSSFLLSSMLASAERGLKQQSSTSTPSEAPGTDYKHVWPEMMFDWRIVSGTIVGFIGAACGSVGGVGGGGIFVPMLSLIIGFDPKSAIAMSKCMIMGAAGSTVSYNLRLRHPTLDMPIIDFDLALLVQPMLMLGISIGVALNVIFADWMVTVLLIFLFIGTSTKAFLKGVETWKKETIMNKVQYIPITSDDGGEEGSDMPFPGGPSNGNEMQTKNSAETTKAIVVISDDGQDGANRPFPGGPSNGTATQTKNSADPKKVSIVKNVRWKELGLLVIVWVVFLVLQITKQNTATCSVVYWALNLLQIPVSVGVSLYEAIRLYQGRKVIASIGDRGTNLKERQLVLYCFCGVLAGMVGGLLGLGGGSILTPLFLELGVPPQVASATATFAMTFSSSMSVVEYYLLKRFPVPYAFYFLGVAAISAFIGQHVVRKVIDFLGRASLIIFVLASTIFVSAISLGGVGISSMIKKIERHEYMGFENLCKYDA